MSSCVVARQNLILLVEDNPTDELLTVRALQESNRSANIRVARNGAEALDFLFGNGTHSNQDLSQLPSFILLDLKLPKINGLQVLRKIRANERTRLVPVIILTSSREEQDLVESYKLGANSYVQKPVDFEEFSKVAAQLGFYWFGLNQLPRYDS